MSGDAAFRNSAQKLKEITFGSKLSLGWNCKVMDLREAADVLTSEHLKNKEPTKSLYKKSHFFTFTPDFDETVI